jgi:uncharacterized protein (TIGR02266 family)
MPEQRQALPRVATTIEITFQHDDVSVRTFMVNLSSGGIFIKTDNPLPIDSPLGMRFHLPGDPEIMEMQGTVVWVKQKSNVFPAGMGVQFTEIAPVHCARIQAFVESCRQERQEGPPYKVAGEAALL